MHEVVHIIAVVAKRVFFSTKRQQFMCCVSILQLQHSVRKGGKAEVSNETDAERICCAHQ